MRKNLGLVVGDITWLAASTPQLLTDPKNGSQKFDEAGNPFWFMDILLVGDTMETIRFRSIAIEPSITVGVPIELKGASVRPWRFNGKTGVTFYADAIDVKGSSSSNKTSN